MRIICYLAAQRFETYMGYILEGREINKHFGSFHVLNDVSIGVSEGQITGLLGPNGAGKTTLIRILNQITQPDTGSLFFKGAPLSAEVLKSIGYLPEERGLYRKMKVWEQALYLSRLKGMSQAEATKGLNDWFEKLDMLSWKNKPVESLSKGMQQKLQFVITVVSKPDLLILDEPFSGFDPVNAAEIKDQILQLNSEGVSVILSTHNMESVEELCSEICMINQGKVVLDGNVQSIKSAHASDQFFVKFEGSHVGFANALGHQFEILDIKSNQDFHQSVIQSHGNAQPNDLLRALTSSVNLIEFSKRLPSMNDIFLKVVEDSKSLEHAE